MYPIAAAAAAAAVVPPTAPQAQVFYPPAAYGVSTIGPIGGGTGKHPPSSLNINSGAGPPPPPSSAGMMVGIDKLIEAVKSQIEYYFSVNNLIKDMFLRSKMNDDGWIPLMVIAAFNRVRMLTPDPAFILKSLEGSTMVQISPDNFYLRPREGWAQWVLPVGQRDESVHALLKAAFGLPVISGGGRPGNSMGGYKKGGSKQYNNNNNFHQQQQQQQQHHHHHHHQGGHNNKHHINNQQQQQQQQQEERGKDKSNITAKPNATAVASNVEAATLVADSSQDNKATAATTTVHEDEDDLFMMDEDHAAAAEKTDAASVHNNTKRSVLEDSELAKLIVVKPSLRSPSKPDLVAAAAAAAGGDGHKDVATVITDGLRHYVRHLSAGKKDQQEQGGSGVGKSALSSSLASAFKPGSSGGVATAPMATTRRSSAFYPSSLPKRDAHHSYYRSNGGSSSLHNNQYHNHNQQHHGSNRAGMTPPSVSVGWLLGSTPPSSHEGGFIGSSSLNNNSYNSNRHNMTNLSSSLPIPKFQHPSYALLENNGFTQIKYEKFKNRCLAERAELGAGKSEEMNTLFRFWCYFLRDHFSASMYADLRKYALEDAVAQYHYGLECLFRFYSYGLEKDFRLDIYRDFEDLVLQDYSKGSLYGLEKLWAFHHYHGFPAGANMMMNPKVKELLDEDYKSLEDFKARAKRLPQKQEGEGKERVEGNGLVVDEQQQQGVNGSGAPVAAS
jgi:la-related protein 1